MLLILAAAYLIQAVSPLRLNHDSVLYFRIAMAFADGTVLPHLGLPHGYPELIAAIDRAGLNVKTVLILINSASTFAGLFGAWISLASFSVRARRIAIVITLLTFSLVRSNVVPEPDALYFGLSFLALAAMQTALQPSAKRPFLLLLGALMLVVVSLKLRSAAVALILPLLLTTWQLVAPTASASRFSNRTLASFGAIVTAVLIVTFMLFFGIEAIAGYGKSAMLWYSGQGVMHWIVERAGSTVNRLGELSINVPAFKYPVIQPYRKFAGLLIAFALLLYHPRMKRLDAVHLYAASYIAMLILWPYDAARLWTPIVPLLVAFVVTVVEDLDRRPVWILAGAWAMWIGILGTGAIVYTTRISFAGEEFPNVYGVRGGMTTPGNEWRNPHHDFFATMILTRYDPLQLQWRKSLAEESTTCRAPCR